MAKVIRPQRRYYARCRPHENLRAPPRPALPAELSATQLAQRFARK